MINKYRRVFVPKTKLSPKDKLIATLYIILIIAVFYFHISFALAAQIRDMNDGDEATAEISRTDINRIKLAGDRIRSTKFNAGELEISQDDNLGEIYIRPTKFAENKPLNLFIITEQNFTYKFLLYPKAVPSEQIIIKNDSVVANSDAEVSKIAKNSYQQQIIALIKAMRTKTKLESYQISNSKKYIDLGDLELKRTSTYKGQSFIGESFILKNDSNQIITLEEKMFFKNGVRAIKIENPALLPDEVTEIFIVS
jgi:type-F conjugative transfer system secretin TraK